MNMNMNMRHNLTNVIFGNDNSTLFLIQQENNKLINALTADCNTKQQLYLAEVAKNHNAHIKILELESGRFTYTLKCITGIIYSLVCVKIDTQKEFTHVFSTSLNDNMDLFPIKYTSLADYYAKNPICKKAFTVVIDALQPHWDVSLTLLPNGTEIPVKFVPKNTSNGTPVQNNKEIHLITSRVTPTPTVAPPSAHAHAAAPATVPAPEPSPATAPATTPVVTHMRETFTQQEEPFQNDIEIPVVLKTPPPKRTSLIPPKAPKKLILSKLKTSDEHDQRSRERSRSPKRRK